PLHRSHSRSDITTPPDPDPRTTRTDPPTHQLDLHQLDLLREPPRNRQQQDPSRDAQNRKIVMLRSPGLSCPVLSCPVLVLRVTGAVTSPVCVSTAGFSFACSQFSDRHSE